MKKKGLIITILVLSLTVGLGVVFFVFIQPRYFKADKVAQEKGIMVNAVDLVAEFSKDENTAFKKYNDKVLLVKGEVSEIGKDQESNMIITLKSSDPFSNVICTMRKPYNEIKGGTTVSIKGVFIGFLSDVKLQDCILDKE